MPFEVTLPFCPEYSVLIHNQSAIKSTMQSFTLPLVPQMKDTTTSDVCEPEDICYHQEQHPAGGALPQPKSGHKKQRQPPPPPPTVATAPLTAPHNTAPPIDFAKQLHHARAVPGAPALGPWTSCRLLRCLVRLKCWEERTERWCARARACVCVGEPRLKRVQSTIRLYHLYPHQSLPRGHYPF